MTPPRHGFNQMPAQFVEIPDATLPNLTKLGVESMTAALLEFASPPSRYLMKVFLHNFKLDRSCR